jgi:predicted dehydrogenase
MRSSPDCPAEDRSACPPPARCRRATRHAIAWSTTAQGDFSCTTSPPRPPRSAWRTKPVEEFGLEPGEATYPLEAPARQFADLINGEEVENLAPGESAARAVELLDAAYRSAADGRVTVVEPRPAS